MGIRNLAIAGSHQDFFADVYDDSWGKDPSTVSECASAWDAAVSYFNDIFHNSSGLIRDQIVIVWPINEGKTAAKVFDVWAEVNPTNEPYEFDVVVEATERQNANAPNN